MADKVKISLSKLEWEILRDDIKSVFTHTPLSGWPLESYIISEMYYKKMAFWEIYPHKTNGKKLKLSMTMIQALAVNQLLGAVSEKYNDLLRLKIEPQLIV